MSVSIEIVDGAVPRRADDQTACGAGVGAVLVFEGIVRGTEGGAGIDALRYELYEPMTQRQLDRLASAMVMRHRLESLSVVHSRGRVAVGEPSMRVIIRSAHRAEALAAMAEFVDALKRDVPIWKSPVPSHGTPGNDG